MAFSPQSRRRPTRRYQVRSLGPISIHIVVIHISHPHPSFHMSNSHHPRSAPIRQSHQSFTCAIHTIHAAPSHAVCMLASLISHTCPSSQ